jgi:UDP-GlcNAc3NAcA epimerase
MKIVTVLGARPQFIKAASLSREFSKHDSIREVIVHTGQHYDPNMSDIFFDEMEIPSPHYNLRINEKNHGAMTGKMLEGIEAILLKEKPDIVLVYGDTNSTLAGSLAASKLHIPIAHVESGLRSFNRKMPEEINRILTDHISALLFAPTFNAVTNLEKEGIPKNKVFLVGDIMYDAVQYYKGKAVERSMIVDSLRLKSDDFILLTIHRAENTDNLEVLDLIVKQIELLGEEKTIVFPIHPRTLSRLGKPIKSKNIKVLDPLGYLDMLQLQMNCRLIVTDSGGIQKEAYFNQKFCITVREETEWTELVNGGFNHLVSPFEISQRVHDLWFKQFPIDGTRFYGNGDATQKILSTFLNFYQ